MRGKYTILSGDIDGDAINIGIYTLPKSEMGDNMTSTEWNPAPPEPSCVVDNQIVKCKIIDYEGLWHQYKFCETCNKKFE